MVELATALGVGIIATFAPLFVGLVLPKYITKLRNQYVAIWLVAAAAGIIFWFFLDVMLDAAQLDVNEGFTTGLGDYTHPILTLTFAVGVGLLFLLEKRSSKSGVANSDGPQIVFEKGSWAMGMTFATAALAALAVGFHALGEGILIGGALPGATSVLDAIGGVLPGLAYVLHKLLEGFVIGVFAVVASGTSARRIAILGALSGVPTVVGFFVGIPQINVATYFFALGGAGAVYIELKLIPLISRSGQLYTSIVPVLLGFYAMYFAGLFHS